MQEHDRSFRQQTISGDINANNTSRAHAHSKFPAAAKNCLYSPLECLQWKVEYKPKHAQLKLHAIRHSFDAQW